MNILLATSEAVPFAKTGGLADVCGALPIELARLGHRAALILPAYRQTRYCGQPIEPLGIDFIVPIGSKMVTGRLLRSMMPGDGCAGVPGRAGPVLRPRRALQRRRQGLHRQLRAVRLFHRAVLEAIRLLDLAGRRAARQRLADRAGAGLSEDRVSQRAALPADRQPADHPQHVLPGPVLALGHAADRPGLEVLQLAADGVPRQPEPAEDRHGVCRCDQHRQPALCAGNSERAVGLRAGGRAAIPARRALRHSQRHRCRRVEPGDRSAPGGQLRRRDGRAGQADLQGGAAERTGPAAAVRPCRWWDSSAG